MKSSAAMRVPQREIEALLGGALLNIVGKAAEDITVKKSKLIRKKVNLPKCGYVMHYLEREAVSSTDDKSNSQDTKSQPTILFFHGISGRSEDFAKFIIKLRIPPHIRILVPEQIGHGRDMERVKRDASNFSQPTHEAMLKSTSEFFDEVKVSSSCNAFGISMGGSVCYHLHKHRPDVIQRSVLVSPAILSCVDKGLITGIKDGTNNFLCAENREDIKLSMRDLSTGRDDAGRKKKDPIPKFFYESIFRNSQNVAPKGYHKAMLLSLLNPNINPEGDGSESNQFVASTDVDTKSHRLVIWPEKDRIINCEQGKHFFEVSTTFGGNLMSKSSNTKFEIVPDCGHVFHSDGRVIFDLIRTAVRDYLLNFEPVS